MHDMDWGKLEKVHRRTGGLEMAEYLLEFFPLVHRRTGGLEMQATIIVGHSGVHRRTGGLEILKKAEQTLT